MRTTFSIPARYRAHVMGVLALLTRETARDAEYRRDEDAQIRRFAPVDAALIDDTATGMVTITVDVDPNAPEPTGDFSHYTRVGDSLEKEKV